MRAEEVPSRTSSVGEYLAQTYIQSDTLGKTISEKHLKKQRLHGFIFHVVHKAHNTTSKTCTNSAVYVQICKQNKQISIQGEGHMWVVK